LGVGKRREKWYCKSVGEKGVISKQQNILVKIEIQFQTDYTHYGDGRKKLPTRRRRGGRRRGGKEMCRSGLIKGSLSFSHLCTNRILGYKKRLG